MTLRERLIALKGLLFGDTTKWIQNNAAVLANGEPVIISAPNAVGFCLAGGVERVLRDEFGDEFDLIPFGERPSHGMVIALSDAIGRLGFDARVRRSYDPIESLIGDPNTRVVRFNDSERTNAADARLVLESAIEWAES